MGRSNEVQRMRRTGSPADEIARHIVSRRKRRLLRNCLLAAGLIAGLGFAAARDERLQQTIRHQLESILHTPASRHPSAVVYSGLSDPKQVTVVAFDK